jgi:peptidoglycan/LPS O-acetylase OafA/YrhL
LPGIGVVIVLVALLGITNVIDVRNRGLLGAITYSTNWSNITGGRSYWDAFASPDPFEHLWSLAIEEQIYVIWPLVIAALVMFGCSRRTIRFAAAAVAITSLIVAWVGASHGWSIDRLYQGTDTRASTFALGAVFAGVSFRRLPSWLNQVLLVVALAIGAWLARHGVADTAMFHGRMALISVCGLVAVMAAAAITTGPMCHPVLRRLGLWSYGIYLFHRPIALAFDDASRWVRFVLVLVFTILVAAVSYTIVEQPIRHRLMKPASWIAAIVVMVSALATGVVVAQPVAPSDEALAPITLPSDGAGATSSTVKPRVLVIGDSVPALASRQIVDVGQDMGYEVGVVAEPACVPSPHAEDQYVPDVCVPFIDALSTTIEDNRPDFVVWWWGGTGAGSDWNGSSVLYCTSNGRAAVEERTDWLQALVGDRPTAIVLPVPRSDQNAEQVAGTLCESETMRQSVDMTRTTILPLAELVCPSWPDDCDRIERVDGLHYSTRGAEQVAEWIFERVADIVDRG